MNKDQKIAQVLLLNLHHNNYKRKSRFLKRELWNWETWLTVYNCAFTISTKTMTQKNISSLSSVITSVNRSFENRNPKGQASYLVEMFKGEHNLSNIDLHLMLCETLSLRKMSKKLSTIYII